MTAPSFPSYTELKFDIKQEIMPTKGTDTDIDNP